MFLKSIYLKNFGCYEDHQFSFVREDNTPYRYVCFFGPNGSGKTSCLDAIKMLTWNIAEITHDRLYYQIRKYIRNKDYVAGMYDQKDTGHRMIGGDRYVFQELDMDTNVDMIVRGVFDIRGKEYVVELTPNGFNRNDLAPEIEYEDKVGEIKKRISHDGPFKQHHLTVRDRIIHSLKTDSDLSMSKFRLHLEHAKDFEKIIGIITGFETECIMPSGFVESELDYVTDYTILKNGYKIHYKRMSAGERKIAKCFSEALNLIYELSHPGPGELNMKGLPALLLMDNVVMHVYYKRHVQMVECLKEVFGQQQIFCTTHSGVLINRYINEENDRENELMIDLEPITC